VEEAALLMPVQRVVGRIQIENDLLGRRLVGLEEEGDEQALDGGRIVPDLVVAVRFRRHVFEPVERALAGERRAIRWIATLERDPEIDQEMLAGLKVETGYVFEQLDDGEDPERVDVMIGLIAADVRNLADGRSGKGRLWLDGDSFDQPLRWW
jgi:hypothetical protein